MLAGQLADSGDYNAALAELQAMSRRSPEDFDLLFMQAQLAYKAGQLQQARTLLQQYLDVQNQRQRATVPGATDAGAAAADAHVLLSRIAEDQGRYDEAINELGRIEDPTLRYSVRMRRALRAKEGRVDDALSMIDAAGPQDEEERTQGVLTKAQILRDADRVGQAVAVLEAADRDLPDTVEIKYELAMLYERQDRVADLERLLRQVIALDGPCPRLQRAGLHAGRPQPAAARGAGPDHAGAGAGAQRSVHPGQHGLGQVPHGRPGRRGRIPAPRLQHASRGRHRRPPGRSAVEPGQARPGGGAAARRQAQGPDQPRPARHDQAAGGRALTTAVMLRWRDASAWLRGALMAMLAFTLAACTTTPKPIEGIGPDAFSRIGRFAITVNEESGKQNAVQGGFSWSDDGRRYVLDLTNPLGSTEARVEGQPGSASLTKADGTRLMADNPDALAEDALGSSMPVAGLRDWLRGKLPAEPEPGELSRDELGRPAGFEQGGWRVRLSRYDTKGPMLLVMERQEPGRRILVRLVVNQP